MQCPGGRALFPSPAPVQDFGKPEHAEKTASPGRSSRFEVAGFSEHARIRRNGAKYSADMPSANEPEPRIGWSIVGPRPQGGAVTAGGVEARSSSRLPGRAVLADSEVLTRRAVSTGSAFDASRAQIPGRLDGQPPLQLKSPLLHSHSCATREQSRRSRQGRYWSSCEAEPGSVAANSARGVNQEIADAHPAGSDEKLPSSVSSLIRHDGDDTWPDVDENTAATFCCTFFTIGHSRGRCTATARSFFIHALRRCPTQ